MNEGKREMKNSKRKNNKSDSSPLLDPPNLNLNLLNKVASIRNDSRKLKRMQQLIEAYD